MISFPTGKTPDGVEVGCIEKSFNRLEHHDTLVEIYQPHLHAAAAAGAKQVICFSGNREGLSDAEGLQNCATGLRRLLPLAEELGLILCMEQLNSKIDHPDYQCDRSAWGVAPCKELDSANFGLLCDIYHMQIMEGDIIRTIRGNHRWFTHYHTGGCPGRNEIDDTQEFNVCDRFVIEPSSRQVEGKKLPDAETVDLVVNKLKKRFTFPGPTDKGFLESLIMGKGGFCYDFDPKENDWLRENFRKMAETLSEENTSERFRIDVRISIGSMAKFHGESRNIREDAQELLRRISEKNDYSSYDITYHALGPQDWRSREKSRKKWKKPIHQGVGTLTLEDGSCATVKLRVEKEGYVFTLDFEDVDGLAAFRETKLFQKTHWNLGAE